MLTLTEIKKTVEELARQIDASADQMPTFNNSRNDGTPDVSLNETDYFYVARDQDAVCINRKTRDMDELLYWVFCDVTSRMASSYIRKVPGPLHERVEIRKNYQLELLGKLKKEWYEKLQKEAIQI